jgi:hypothetical protein
VGEICKRTRHDVIASPLTGGNTMAELIIFILIIKQRGGCKKDGHNKLFNNSTLFILILYIMACCGKVSLGY